MGHDFYESSPESRKIFESASRASGIDLERVCFSGDDSLNRTEFVQPALLTAEIATLTAVKEQLLGAPSFFGGHSLGEYSALVAAGVIPFEDAVKIVTKRGALMQQAADKRGGGMAALVLKDIESTGYRAVVERSGAEVANYNSADQVVISGTQEAIAAACKSLEQEYATMRIVPLQVSAPFHCSLMKDVEAEFGAYLRSFQGNMRAEKAPQVASNFTGGFHTPETLLENLVRQIAGPVQWRKNMTTFAATGAAVVEIGPTRVLSKFFTDSGLAAKTISDLRSLQKYSQGAAA